MGLTTNEPEGTEKGEPNKYYPTGKTGTTCVSCPEDTIQGAALATSMKEDGCKSVYIVNDKEVTAPGWPPTSRTPPRSRASM